jgi:hypothetical protein
MRRGAAPPRAPHYHRKNVINSRREVYMLYILLENNKIITGFELCIER